MRPPPVAPEKIPFKAWTPEPRPAPPQQPLLQGDLYIRGDDSLDRTITGSPALITSCPTSLEWLMYLKAVKIMLGNFVFDIHFITNDEAPRFETGGHIYNNLNELNESRSPLSLEREVTIWKEDMTSALTKVRNAFLVGYRLLCRPDIGWLTRDLDNIRTLEGHHDYAIIEQNLEQQMKDACQCLSSELGKHKTFLVALRNTGDTEVAGVRSLSIVDIQLVASGSLIRKCFEIENVSTYLTTIRTILYGYISLWAHNDIIYSWSTMREIEPLDFTATLNQNPELLASTVREAGAHASGGQGDVYKVSLEKDNIWGLDIGDYAFKVSKGFEIKGCLAKSVMSEVGVLINTPIENMTKVVGQGQGKLNDREVFFFAMKWMSGGSLYDRMEDLNPSQIKKVLKGVAYVLHLLYASICGCVVDLKPQNILLDENDNPILCDFGSFTYTEVALDGECSGTSLYHDRSTKATHGRDIFAYGVIIFQLLTDEVHEMRHGLSLA